jgi:hypothetical protein
LIDLVAVEFARTVPSNPGNKKAARKSGFVVETGCPALLYLAFFEDDVLARNRVVLPKFKLLGLGAGILLGHVEVTGIRRAHEFDLDGVALGHENLPFCRDNLMFGAFLSSRGVYLR